MAQLPYMVSASATTKILTKIKEAPTPTKFSLNYLSTTLGFTSPNDKAFVAFAKSLGFLDQSGIPTELYKQFRNPSLSATALGKGIMRAYKPLYNRNENFYNLSKDKLHELVCAETGYDHDNITAKRITNTFIEVKKLAVFDKVNDEIDTETGDEEFNDGEQESIGEETKLVGQPFGKLGLSYNINLILPNTDDPKVFNAIFKSLKENLL
jgi:hypothetical protein